MSLSLLKSKAATALEEEAHGKKAFLEKLQGYISQSNLNTAKLVLTILLAVLISKKEMMDIYLDIMGFPNRSSLLLVNSCVFRKISTSCKLIRSSQ